MSMPGPTKLPRAQFRRTTLVPPSLNVALVVALIPFGLVAYVTVRWIDTGVSGLAVLGLIIAVGPGVLLVFLARAGHWWARALFTLGSLAVLVATIGNAVNLWVTDPEERGFVIPSTILSIVMFGAPVVLLWLPASNAYFRAVAVEKRQFRESMLR